METKNITVKPKRDVLVIREGNAPDLVPNYRDSYTVEGTITVPKRHLSKSSAWFVAKEDGGDAPVQNSYVKVDREGMFIEFYEDVGYPWGSVYKGALQFDERYTRFKINSGKSCTPYELADFIKMNRSFFETKDKAMALVTKLRDFEAHVNKEIQAKSDDRANRKILLSQAVETNLPENFIVVVPVFKGIESQRIEVEITIHPDDLSCRLISPEVYDYIESTRDDIIDGEIGAIEALHPELRIFEV